MLTVCSTIRAGTPRRRYTALALGGAALLLNTPAFAGSGSGNVAGVSVESASGKFSTTAHTGAPACATTGRWAVDVSTPQGQSLWSEVLLAYSQNKTVNIAGTGLCSVWGDSETVAWIYLP